MSDIPYNFTAIPNFLIDSGWMDDPLTCRLFVCLFRRIRYEPHTEVINGREIHLDAFEFIFGRDSVAEETGLTPKQVQLRWDKIQGSKMVSKTVSKTVSRYTVYKWIESHFISNYGQQKDQQKDQQRDSNWVTKKNLRLSMNSLLETDLDVYSRAIKCESPLGSGLFCKKDGNRCLPSYSTLAFISNIQREVFHVY